MISLGQDSDENVSKAALKLSNKNYKDHKIEDEFREIGEKFRRNIELNEEKIPVKKKSDSLIFQSSKSFLNEDNNIEEEKQTKANYFLTTNKA